MKNKECILIVDDEVHNLEIMTRIFEGEGFRVVTSMNEKETFEIINQDKPDIILLDIVLNNENGLDILKKIKQDQEFRYVYVVMISGKINSPLDKAKGLELGADGYLSRPFEKRELIARIEAFMRHKRTLDDLRKSEQRFKKIIERNPDAILIVDNEGSIKFANPAAEQLFKITVNELLSRVFGYPVIKGKHTEINIVRHDENTVVGEMRTIDIDWDDRETYLTSIRDITERKKIENAIRESEEKMRITLNSIGDAVIATNDKGLIISMNPVAERLTEWSFEEACGKPLPEVFHIINSQTRNTVENPVDIVIESGKIVGLANHTLLISKKGQEYQIADSGAPIMDDKGDIKGVVLVFRDVTSEYALRQQIVASEKRFRSLFEQSGDGIAVHDLEGELIDVNLKLCELIGYNKEEFLKSNLIETSPNKEIIKINEKAFAKLKEEGEVLFETEFQTKTGELLIGEISAKVVEIGDKKLVHAIMRDITDRKKASELLLKSEEEYRQLVETLNEGILKIDMAGNISFVNPKMAEMLGYYVEETIGLSILDIVHEDEHKKVTSLFQSQTIAEHKQTELKFKKKNGQIITMLINSSSIPDQQNKFSGALLGAADITEIKKVQKELQLYKEQLEDLVQERTSKLEEKNTQLEQFNKIFVGREFRIKELRDEVKSLKDELKAYKRN
ncbi:MAG: PAS domain S-box protein [Bacteroidales bacterium]|nr:PAS domain S-box protein [Bacteroidales bacterium]MCF8404235.1 PAS domain S-box protein [Bacteroidales bacterium]